MTAFVVDTNVAIVANEREIEVDAGCRLACVQKLTSVAKSEVVSIDDQGLILAEYARHLHYSGIPGVGDAFFKHVFNHQHRDDFVLRVAVTPSEDTERGFEELPENTFDPSDRKFLAVAVVAGAIVLNATDSDWAEQKALVDSLGIEVSQLCPRYALKRSRREQ